MKEVTYIVLSEENFDKYSLDQFIRYQEVKECWRKVEDQWVLLPIAYTENWDVQKCREIAEDIQRGLDGEYVAYGALEQNHIVGFIVLKRPLFGSACQYVELALFQVSEPFRHAGIGKQLFRMACEGARELGAKKLYISAHSSKESQAAYRKLGCIEAMEINETLAENEPCDVQMEYQL